MGELEHEFSKVFIGINKRESVVVLKDSKKNKHIYIHVPTFNIDPFF